MVHKIAGLPCINTCTDKEAFPRSEISWHEMHASDDLSKRENCFGTTNCQAHLRQLGLPTVLKEVQICFATETLEAALVPVMWIKVRRHGSEH